MSITTTKKTVPAKLKKPEPPKVENFRTILDPLKPQRNPPCRFEMFVVKKPEHGKFVNDKYEWCHRGDKYSPEDYKMLKFLLGIVKNHYNLHSLMELYDNSKPKAAGERLILKLFKGRIQVNRLTEYAHLLTNFHLPEWLSYEVKN